MGVTVVCKDSKLTYQAKVRELDEIDTGHQYISLVEVKWKTEKVRHKQVDMPDDTTTDDALKTPTMSSPGSNVAMNNLSKLEEHEC